MQIQLEQVALISEEAREQSLHATRVQAEMGQTTQSAQEVIGQGCSDQTWTLRSNKAAALCAPLYNGSHHDGLLLSTQKFFKSDTSLKRAAMLWGFSQRYYPQLKDWQNNDPLALSASFDPRGAPEIYLSCGQNDDWGCMQSSQILVDSIKKNSGNIQWVPRPGGHCDIDHRSLALFLQ